ncbi:hypothetical protein F4555_000413 [Mobiluncus mulieris]|uniref:Uncharacterized protein n=1 Tax=Mobiluncus mulieris TaxID=2052 RepID=A0A8G2HSC3_9ACTO|nr:hypothetical protein [Mobiluncus mulieris]STO09682.1 Uncharacterised protein [Mobiluncus mulieris]STO09684.1 Uncharacterised protein [Mobiluncus mulieris]STO15715.1 Uncharacterised protein [Mobiluncus mulieris]
MGELQAIEIWRDEIRDKVFRRSGAATQPVTIFRVVNLARVRHGERILLCLSTKRAL